MSRLLTYLVSTDPDFGIHTCHDFCSIFRKKNKHSSDSLKKNDFVASLILCSTISSSYSSLDPLCYDHQLTGLYLVRQLTINSLLIRQYIQSITSTQPNKISSLTEVTLTQPVNVSSLHRSADVPTPFHRLATI